MTHCRFKSSCPLGSPSPTPVAAAQRSTATTYDDSYDDSYANRYGDSFEAGLSRSEKTAIRHF
jgi:hypothetical protein